MGKLYLYLFTIAIHPIRQQFQLIQISSKKPPVWSTLFEKYIDILALEMASPWNRHCANCIGALSFGGYCTPERVSRSVTMGRPGLPSSCLANQSDRVSPA